MALEVGGWPLG